MQTCDRTFSTRDMTPSKVSYLVELQRVKQIVQLSVLGGLLQLDVVLLQTVQSKLGLVVHVDLKRLQLSESM